MITMVVLAAGMLSAPELDKRSMSSDYPMGALQDNKSAAALIELTINRQGTVEACRVMATVGNDPFGRTLCAPWKRTHWSPAKDTDGTPVTGIYRTLYKLSVDTAEGATVRSAQMRPDLELSAQSLPESSDKPLDLKVTLQIDMQGAVVACEPKGGPKMPRIEKIACEQSANITFSPLIGQDGKPMPFVTNWNVRITGRSHM